jgi:hypothetical protein
VLASARRRLAAPSEAPHQLAGGPCLPLRSGRIIFTEILGPPSRPSRPARFAWAALYAGRARYRAEGKEAKDESSPEI